MSDYHGVMVFAEQDAGQIHPVVYELLGKGNDLASELNVNLSCVILGSKIEEEKIRELIFHGADKVFLYNHEKLEEFDPIIYANNIADLVKEEKPEIILLGATHLGRSLGPRIAAALSTGLTADCTGLKLDEDKNLIQIRPAFTGNILAHIKTKTRPQMATVRYKVMEKAKRDPLRKGEIIQKETLIRETGLKITEKIRFTEINLAEAEIIVSCGMGIKKAEDIDLIKKLANSLGGLLGSSRPLVDKGWTRKEQQVGFSGNTVKPKIYIACGISGSPQHLAGMKDSEIIIAINTDPSAPIFKVADFGIIGDIYEVVPELIKRISQKAINKEPFDRVNG
jgi:electron transfer flavoprotein alpha subunit